MIETPVHAIDVLPTCFQAAQARVPGEHTLDGRSLIPLITTGADPKLSGRPIYQYYPFYDLRWGLTPNASIRVGEYKLIEFFGDRFDRQHRYVPGHHIELYNLRSDVGESRNLAGEQPQRAKRLREQLHDWLKGLGASVPAKNEHFEPAREFEETRVKPAWLRDAVWQRH